MKKLLLLTLLSATTFYGSDTVGNAGQVVSDHAVVEIGSKNFEQFAAAEKPFILDVWADWCGPCKMMKPIFEEVAKNNPDYVFGSIDFQKEEALAKKLQVRSLPTFVVIKGNKEYGRITGAFASCAKDLLEKINECLANENPTKIGSDVPLSPQEYMMKLSALRQKPEKDQVAELEALLKAGLTPDMVLMEMPAMGGRPAFKFTAITMVLGTNKAFLQVLLNHGADVDVISTEIDTRISMLNQELAKMNEFKEVLKAHTSNSSSVSVSK